MLVKHEPKFFRKEPNGLGLLKVKGCGAASDSTCFLDFEQGRVCVTPWYFLVELRVLSESSSPSYIVFLSL